VPAGTGEPLRARRRLLAGVSRAAPWRADPSGEEVANLARAEPEAVFPWHDRPIREAAADLTPRDPRRRSAREGDPRRAAGVREADRVGLSEQALPAEAHQEGLRRRRRASLRPQRPPAGGGPEANPQ